MIVVTGASGQLGRLVIEELLKTEDPANIIAAVRTLSKAKEFEALGVQVREADYSRPETLRNAFKNASRVLLISGNELGERVVQHRAVLDAAKTSGVAFVAYTSILACDSSPLVLAKDHLATERALIGSGLAYSLLRNGWYFENQTAAIPQALEHGSLIGASGEGRFAAAARQDYATAAAVVLTQAQYDNSVLELAGDESYTRTELAAEISQQSGKTVHYNNLSEAEFRAVLSKFLPAEMAQAIADAEVGAAKGALDDHSHTLSRVIGRPAVTLAQSVEAALKNPPAAH